ncbi:MAG: hypothetical protein LBV12_09970 [Puniceicoccales bacterium]|jgi:hypothetical protein|nr:hypothetical protein [Puniceicoccales bacterium]
MMMGRGFGAERVVSNLVAEDSAEVSFFVLRTWSSLGDVYFYQYESPGNNEIFAFNGVRLALTNVLYAWDAVPAQWRPVPLAPWDSTAWYDGSGSYQDFEKITVRLDGTSGLYSVQVGDGEWLEGLSYQRETGSLELSFQYAKGDVLMVDDVVVKRIYEGDPYDPSGPDDTWDSDGDGIPDWWELYLGSDPFVSDANSRAAGTSYTYGQRYAALVAGQADPAGIVPVPDSGGGDNTGGSTTPLPGAKTRADTDKDGFTDYQEQYFKYNHEDAAVHPHLPRYVVVDLGPVAERGTPIAISDQNGWVLSNTGFRWHAGAWLKDALPLHPPATRYSFLKDISNNGAVAGMGDEPWGAHGYYYGADGQKVTTGATQTTTYGSFAYPYMFNKSGGANFICAPRGGSPSSGGSYCVDYRITASCNDMAPLDVGNFISGPSPGKCFANNLPLPLPMSRGGASLYSPDSLVQGGNPVTPAYTVSQGTVLAPTLGEIALADLVRYDETLRAVNDDLVMVGVDGAGIRVWKQRNTKSKTSTGGLLPVRSVDPNVGDPFSLNTPEDKDYLVASATHMWLRKRDAQGALVSPLAFEPAIRLAELVDWNCGWVDQWDISGMNDAGYLIGTGYKIVPGQEAKTDGGELIIDFKDEAYSNNGQPTSAIKEHGFLMLPMEVRGLVTMSQNTGRSSKRWVVPDDTAPGGVMTKLVNELEIAQWYNPIEEYDFPNQKIVFKEQGLSLDPDAFYVRIKAPPPPAGQDQPPCHQVRIWTTGCPDSSYNDAGAVVDLIHYGDGVYQTEPLYLVADHDDAGADIGSTTGRRAFCVQLGGEVCVRFLGLNRPDIREPDRVLAVPAKKVLSLQGFIMRKTGIFSDHIYGNTDDLRLRLKKAIERLATCGIRVDGSLFIQDIPAGVNLDNGLDVVAGEDPDYKIRMAAECKALIDGVSINANAIPFFFVPYQDISSNHGSVGFSWIPCVLYPSEAAYGNSILLNTNYDSEEYGSNVLKYSLGHELLHILMNAIHVWSLEPNENDIIKFTDDYKIKPKSLWYGTGSINPDIYQTKRISDEMKNVILKSTFLQNP